MLKEKWEKLGDCSPLAALKSAGETRWLIDKVIASGSINWMVAAPSSFKSFVAIDMATCVSTGRPWHGRETSEGVVLYLAGEGDTDVHVRRAAAEMAAGDAGLLAIAQVRPRLDTPEGLPALTALICNATAGDSPLSRETDAYNEGGDDNWHDKYLSQEEIEQLEERCRKSASVATKPLRIEKRGINESHADFEARRNRQYAEQQAERDELYERAWQETAHYRAELARPRASAYDATMLRYLGIAPRLSLDDYGASESVNQNVFLIIDTYSQTSEDDSKGAVSAYIKTLKGMQDKFKAAGGTLTILVIDHTTKSGDSYMGSLAKEGDSDAMIEVNRRGNDYSVTLNNTKMRSAACFEPIHLNLEPFTLGGFNDALGRPLTSLIVVDGEDAHKVRKLAGDKGETAAALVLSLLTRNGARSKPDLKDLFTSHSSNEGKKDDAMKRAFNRALSHLENNGLIVTDTLGLISIVQDDDLLA